MTTHDGRQNLDSEVIDNVLDEIIGSRNLTPATVRGLMPSSRPRPEEERWALRLPQAEKSPSSDNSITEFAAPCVCRAVGLLLWGVDDSTEIQSLRVDRSEQLVQAVPGRLFEAQESWERFTLRLRPTRLATRVDAFERDTWTTGRFPSTDAVPEFTWLDLTTAETGQDIVLQYRGALAHAELIASVLAGES